MTDFKGVPISSKSQMNIPVQVVSQPSVHTIPGASSDDKSANTSPEPQEGTASAEGSEGKSTEAQIDFDDFMGSNIVAIPKRIATILDVRAKDPNFRLRWVNCLADGGRRVDEAKAMGFVAAKVEEVITFDGKPLQPDSIMVKSPSEIKYHDVLLMKIPTRLLYGWYKQNAIDSAAKVSPRRLHQAAAEEGNRILRQGIANEGRSYNDVKDLIGVYIPNANDVPNK